MTIASSISATFFAGRVSGWLFYRGRFSTLGAYVVTDPREEVT
jgi:hypothetical protein